MRHEENTTHHKKLFNWFTFSTGKAMFFKTDWRLFSDYFERIKPRGDELWVTNGRVNEIWQSLYDDLRRPYIMQRYPMNFIEMHKDDAAARGIETGDLVAVENDDLLIQTGGQFGVRDEDSLFTGLMKNGHIKRSRAALTAMAVVNTDVKKGVTFMYFLWPGSSFNSLMHAVPDPITAAPRYKTAKGRIRKIGETAAKRSGILRGLEHKNTMPEWA
jgi:arsenite oxidase large subunit